MNVTVNLADTNACGVYAITNLSNCKKYIGSTGVSFRRRWTEHRRLLRKGEHTARHLQKSWKKHGECNFEFSALCVCDAIHVIEMEQYFIDFFNSANEEFGYNQSPAAGSQLGIKRSPETIEKMRAAMIGHGHSEATRAKMSKTRTGRKHSSEHALAISRGLVGKMKHSEETREKIAAGHRGKKISLEHKHKLHAAAHTPEAESKRVASRAGYRHSPETIEKIRLSNIASKSKTKASLQLN